MEKNTRQRAAIAETVHGAQRPLLPREILERARRHVPTLSLATVYRNLKLPRGFTAEDHEITFYGRCAECQRRGRPGRAAKGAA